MIESLYEPFRHWAETGSVYLLGDTHFDNPDVHKMDPDMISAEEQLDIINGIVRKNDTFIHRMTIDMATERKAEKKHAEGRNT